MQRDLIKGIKYVGNGLLASFSSHQIKIWDLRDGHIFNSLEFNPFQILVLSNQLIIASESYRNNVTVWNPFSSKSLEKKTFGILTCLEQLNDRLVVFSEKVGPNSSEPSSCTYLSFWEVEGVLLSFVESIRKAHDDSVMCMVVLHDGRFATGSKDKKINIWCRKSKGYDFERALSGHEDGVVCMKLLPNNNLISSSFNKKVRVWNHETGQCLRTIKDPSLYTQFYSFGEFVFCKRGLKSQYLNVLETQDYEFIKEISLTNVHRKKEVDFLEIFEDRYVASTNNEEINIYDFMEDFRKLKYDAQKILAHSNSKRLKQSDYKYH
jgi:WD40 repeat protein